MAFCKLSKEEMRNAIYTNLFTLSIFRKVKTGAAVPNAVYPWAHRRKRWEGPGWRMDRGDALALMQRLPWGSVDALITDPPYGSGGDTDAQRSQRGKKIREYRCPI
uniref:Methyltransferase domain n=1 Tax=Candidatus Kentrum eta TaxID=2126337 RepID=A0A450UKF1_9GAMM|nr:MAG: Methyltransferase domain [Candidatus Kentron sp. H]VFJ93751.1 MAG: Methyltransferase domain [Candidatus Kentron sp. H]VFK00589.1 MAG: Methyltransferase domain [Candidatus Kentron sp. H]